ncbi:MAG: oxygen-independent coproporphyrinogen III oxidase [Rhodospirillaceae bacterium]
MLSIKDLSAKYDLRLPRYTSYPTAPHFSNAVGPETYAQWLSELEHDTPLSLYLHIAYCAEMCWFCGCHTKITKRYDPIADYLEALLAEVALVAKHMPTRMTAKHVHFGGGTPSILSGADFARTLACLRENFLLAEDAEIAVELDPRTATEDYIRTMIEAGVNRASIGVQDFNAKVQEAVNRIQPLHLVEDVFARLRANGVEHINMDLIYGLPHQTTETVLETVEQALALAPRRVSLFGYAHVPWMKKHQRLILDQDLPGAEERWSQYLSASARFVELGYVAIGLDHFAHPEDEMAIALKDGTLQRNFQGYTTDTAPALIGLGASGIGYLPQGYVGNEGEINAYKATVRRGELATKRGIAIDDEDRLRAAVIERLMCDLSVDLDAIAERFERDPDEAFAEDRRALEPLAEDGILTLDGNKITVFEEGRPLVRAVCAAFDRYLKAGEMRHSRAV